MRTNCISCPFMVTQPEHGVLQARDNFQSTPLSAFLSATGGLKVSPVASIITKLLYNGRVEVIV